MIAVQSYFWTGTQVKAANTLEKDITLLAVTETGENNLLRNILQCMNF